MALIFLYETTAMDTLGVIHPIRLSTGGGYNHPSAPGFFEPRIKANTDGLRIKQSIFSDRRTFGFGEADYGYIEVINVDRALDDWIDYGFGRVATVKIGDEQDEYDSFQLVMVGVAGSILPAIETLKIGWKERIEELDTPLQSALFLGNNDGVTGLEGTPKDIGGTRKPYTAGRLLNYPPVLLNSSTRMMGWRWDTDGSRLPTFNLVKLRVLGSENWASIGDFSDPTTLSAQSLTSGQYATCLSESLVKIGGGSPANLSGIVGIDAMIEQDDHKQHAAYQIQSLLLKAGIPSSRIHVADIEALELIAPYSVQVAVRDETVREILDQVMQSVMAVGWVDKNEQYRFLQLEALS